MDIKKLNIKFDFATELTYAELTGKDFDLQAITNEEGHISLRELVNITTAVIIAQNPDVEDPTAFLKENTRQEGIELFNKVGEALRKWFAVPKVAEKHVPEPTEEEKEQEQKNA